MEIIPFTPNYIRNAGRSFEKNGKNGAEARPEPKKKTVIKNAIKEAGEVAPAIEEIIKRKSRGRPKGSLNKKKEDGVKSYTPR